MTTTRNIIVGLDGTWNEPERLPDGSVSGTNVVKFLSALMKRGQTQHYESGAGTRAWELLPGGIYGYGLDKRILGAYRFLRRCYADSDFDADALKLFIVGFSRGAYAARRLAGLLAHSGIPRKGGDIDLGWQMYLNRDSDSAAALRAEHRFIDVSIEMLGVWDTVKATNDADYNDATLSANVVAGYHAMAVDECRKFFPVLRWSEDPRVSEVWFTGSHSDVGGGCAAMDLSDVALKWMIHRGAAHGLKFKKSYIDRHVNPKVPGHVHDCFTGIWKPYGRSDRPISIECAVHNSVAKQVNAGASYAPVNLPASPNYVRG
ncbi:MAG: DUF2235 domain-containing protein [Pseudomonadota bacterium]